MALRTVTLMARLLFIRGVPMRYRYTVKLNGEMDLWGLPCQSPSNFRARPPARADKLKHEQSFHTLQAATPAWRYRIGRRRW